MHRFVVNVITGTKNKMPLLPIVGGGDIFMGYSANLRSSWKWPLKRCACVCVCDSIEKNPQLCYTETVSWRHILPDGFNYRRIQQNKPNYECVDVCPVDSSCPTSDVVGSVPQSSSRTRPLCWNENHCQKGKLAARHAILLMPGHNVFSAPMHASQLNCISQSAR